MNVKSHAPKIDIKRRNALAEAFKMYPDLLVKFAEEHAHFKHVMTGDLKRPTPHQTQTVALILMAQFVTRLVKSATQNSHPDLEAFAAATVHRYDWFRQEYLPNNMTLTAEDKYLKALNAFEQGMFNVIFAALQMEFEIASQPDLPEHAQFDEVGFWVDVALALAQNRKPKVHPQWQIALQRVFLDHLPEFRAALKASRENERPTTH